MGEAAVRDLRNDTRGVLRRVEAGEEVVVTVDGRPVAVLRPLPRRRRWIDAAAVVAMPQADPGLDRDLRVLAPDTTDDLPLR